MQSEVLFPCKKQTIVPNNTKSDGQSGYKINQKKKKQKQNQALEDKHYQFSIFYAESKFKYVCMCMHTFSQVMKVVSEL